MGKWGGGKDVVKVRYCRSRGYGRVGWGRVG
jgi:hypothetical protein